MWAVFKKELKTYFLSPIGYILVGTFLLFCSGYFVYMTQAYMYADFRELYYQIANWGILFFVPILTMKLFSEEKKTGTEQLLLTSPRSVTSIVIGKFLAALAVVAVALTLSITYYVIISFIGNTNFITLLVILLGFLLVYMSAISAGLLASSLTENQIIAAIITIALTMIPSILTSAFSAFSIFNVMTMYEKFSFGLISITDMITTLAYTAMCLAITIIIIKRRKSGKWFIKVGVITTIVCIIIASYVGIYIGIKAINPQDMDLTKDKIYSLSDISKEVAKKIDKHIDIKIFNIDENTTNLINQYHTENEKIHIKVVTDISTEQELVEKYGLTSATSVIIVKCDDKEEVLSYNDLYTIDYTTGEEKDTSEEVITNAMLNVTVETKPKIYYLTGHNKQEIENISYFIGYLGNNVNDVEELNLQEKGTIPKDASLLMLTTLKEDITEKEKDEIIKYIHNGGQIIIFTNPTIEDIKMTNYQKVLDEYGVSISKGIMIEQNAYRTIANTPNYIILDVNQSTDIINKSNMNINACFMTSGKLNFKGDKELEKLGVKVQTIAKTSETAFYRDDINISTSQKQEGEEEETAIVGALLTKTVDNDKTSQLIIYANNMFIQNVEVTQYGQYAIEEYNNRELAFNSISYLTGKNMVMIRKNIETTPYIVTEEQNKNIMRIIFVLPALVFIAGIIVWNVRRRRK